MHYMKFVFAAAIIGCILACFLLPANAITLEEYSNFFTDDVHLTTEQQDANYAKVEQHHMGFLSSATSSKHHVQHVDQIVDKHHGRFHLTDHDDDDHGGDDDNNGNSNGRLGREYRALKQKAQRDIESVKLVYTVPIFDPAHPNDNCEIYASGASIPEWVMHFNSSGRIHPVGAFSDSDQSKEYFLLACPLLDRPLDTQVRVSRVTFPRITAWENRVWIEAKLELSVPATSFFFNHTHTGYFEMDSNSSICGYKLAFQRLELRDPAPETQTDTILNNRILAMCTNVVRDCLNSTADAADKYQPDGTISARDVCITFNSSPARKARNGYQYVDQASLRCAEFHYGLVSQNLARHLPDHVATHCSHSGPRGGGKCVTHAFESFQNDVISCPAA